MAMRRVRPDLTSVSRKIGGCCLRRQKVPGHEVKGSRQWATAAAVENTSAGIGRCSFHVIAIGFSPECWT